MRVIAGSPANPVIGTDVTLVVNGAPRVARSDSAGRAIFKDLPAGATVQAKVTDEDKKEVASDSFPLPDDSGVRVMISTKPIRNLDDFSKLKYRVPESDLQKRFWGKGGMGATPLVLLLADVYLSLRQGAVDAISMPLDLVVPMKFAEVGKYVINSYDYPQFVGVMINEPKWQSLTSPQRKAITDSLDEAGRFYNADIAANVEAWKRDIQQVGAQIVDIDRAPFINRARQLNLQWQKEEFWRPGLLDEVEAARKK